MRDIAKTIVEEGIALLKGNRDYMLEDIHPDFEFFIANGILGNTLEDLSRRHIKGAVGGHDDRIHASCLSLIHNEILILGELSASTSSQRRFDVATPVREIADD